MTKYYKQLPNNDWVEIDSSNTPFYHPEYRRDRVGGLIWLIIVFLFALSPIILPLIFNYFGVLDWLM